MNFDLDFYKGKKVFVTGHTGFKGSWLCKMLANAGAIVTGYSLNPPTSPSQRHKSISISMLQCCHSVFRFFICYTVCLETVFMI